MAHPDNNNRLPHDPAFKAIFSHRRMIADALRGYAVRPNGPLDPRTVAALDFRTLRKLPAEWITRDFRRRLGDQAWQVRFRWARDWSDPGGQLLILAEFQSTVKSDMALRMASYALQLLGELEATGAPRSPIFPLVIHNGSRRWTAPTALDGLVVMPKPPAVAAAHLEDIEDARQAAHNLAAFQLRHTYFPLDFHRHREDDPNSGNALSLLICLESASTLDDLQRPLELLRELVPRRLAGTMLEWTLRRLGVDGETAEEMRRMASLDEFHSQLEITAKGWTEQWFAEGMEKGRTEGMEKGRAEGVAAQRTLLQRQATLRFGAAARNLAPLLDEVHSTAKLTEIGEWLVVDTIDQLIAKVEAAVVDDRFH